MEFGGGLSGEHGDGRARSPFNETLYGPRLYDAFRQVKRAFDPKGILNPGNIVDAPPMTEHLRYGPGLPRVGARDAPRLLGAGRVRRAPSRCATGSASAGRSSRGRCAPRTWRRSTRSTRRAGAPTRCRAVLSGKVPRSEFTGRRLYEVLDLCLECKACKAECPANVDMAKIKYEFLAHYYRANGLPLRNRLFGRIHRAGPDRVGARARLQLDRALGAAPLAPRARGRHRPAPPAARVRGPVRSSAGSAAGKPEGSGARGEVVLFHDTFNTYQTPERRHRRDAAPGGPRATG